jgi:hypothetical protein
MSTRIAPALAGIATGLRRFVMHRRADVRRFLDLVFVCLPEGWTNDNKAILCCRLA